MRYQSEARRFCPDCDKYVLARKDHVNHAMYAVLTAVSCGVWGLVWMLEVLGDVGRQYRCPNCGLSLSTGFARFVKMLAVVVLLGSAGVFLLAGAGLDLRNLGFGERGRPQPPEPSTVTPALSGPATSPSPKQQATPSTIVVTPLVEADNFKRPAVTSPAVRGLDGLDPNQLPATPGK